MSFDPGDTTGFAIFDDNGDLIEYGDVYGRPAVTELLNEHKPDLVICEDWITKAYTTFGGNRMDTTRLIGRIEAWCEDNKVKFVLQPNTVKPIAYKWAGISKPKNKALTHGTDAYVHGVFYLQKIGVRRPQQGRAT